MQKYLSASALVVALAAGGAVVLKPDTKVYVAATVAEDDTMATEVVKSQAGAQVVSCCKTPTQTQGPGSPLVRVWICSSEAGEFAAKASWAAWLDKKAGADGQCVSVDPKEIGSSVAATLTKLTGDPIAARPTVEALKALEPAQAEKPAEKGAQEKP